MGQTKEKTKIKKYLPQIGGGIFMGCWWILLLLFDDNGCCNNNRCDNDCRRKKCCDNDCDRDVLALTLHSILGRFNNCILLRRKDLSYATLLPPIYKILLDTIS